MPYRLASVYAHPDDDAYSIGGTLALHAGELEVTAVVATSGEDGEIANPSLSDRQGLGEVREREERDAMAALGISSPDLHFLRYPDGGLAGVPTEELVDRIAEILRRARPQVVVTFGPEGVTKHDDHVAIHTATTEAFHQLQAENPREAAFRRLFYNAIPQSELDRFWKTLRDRGVEAPDPDAPFMPRGVPDHTITARVDCRRVVEAKVAAIRAHRTQQLDLAYLPEDLLPELVGEEHFVQAWPPVTDPEGPVLSDLFDGLEPA